LVAGSSPAARAQKKTLKHMSQITEYFQDAYEELVTKVTWPSWKELQGSSVLVFVASLLIAGIVFVMDWAFGVNAGDSIWRGVIGLIYELL
jgi:preprotein translocase subunit SecE